MIPAWWACLRYLVLTDACEADLWLQLQSYKQHFLSCNGAPSQSDFMLYAKLRANVWTCRRTSPWLSAA